MVFFSTFLQSGDEGQQQHLAERDIHPPAVRPVHEVVEETMEVDTHSADAMDLDLQQEQPLAHPVPEVGHQEEVPPSP